MKRKNNRPLTKERDPRKKVFALLEKADKLLRTNPEESRRLSFEAMEAAKAVNSPDLVAEIQFMLGTSFFLGSQVKDAKKFYERALAIYKRLGDTDGILDMEYSLVTIGLSSGHNKEHIIRLNDIVHRRMSSLIHTDVVVVEKGSFYIPRLWQDRVLKRIPTPEKAKKIQQNKIAALYNSLGYGYFSIGENHKAASYLEQGLQLSKKLKDHIQTASFMNNLSAVYTHLGNMDIALTNAKKALKINRKLHLTVTMFFNQHNLANIYYKMGHIQRGKRLAAKTFRDLERMKLWEKAGDVLMLQAKWELLHGSLTKAAQLNTSARRILEPYKEDELYFKAELQKLLILYKKNPSREVFMQFVMLYKRTKFKKLEVQHEVAKELARIAQELHMQREAIQWLKIVHAHELERKEIEQKNAIMGIEIEQALERAEKERELNTLKMEKLESELKVKSHETELLAVQLAKKGSVLADLTEQLAMMRGSKTEYSGETINAVISLIETIRFKDKEYEQLEERAKASYHDFIITLKNKFPSLTETEKRVCILLKLGLKPVEVASVLFTSARTVETHCLSIRKKLHLPRKVRLIPYLQEL
jgi:DNA-binding CsgD family transcriptional regulator